MTSRNAARPTADIPAQQAPLTGIDLAALARRYALFLRLSYLGCIAIATLLHLGFDPTPAAAARRLQRALDPTLNFKDIVDAARNIALFLGWGATWVLTSRMPASRRDVLLATLLGLLASVAVESIQLFSAFRQSSIVDVATNTLGSLVGAATLYFLERRAVGDMRRGTIIGIPAWLPAGALLLTAFGLAFAPSNRPSLVIGWVQSPIERAQEVIAAAAANVPWSALVTDAVAWCVAGLAVAIAVRDRTGRVRLGQLAAWLLIVPTLLLVAFYGRAAAGLQREAHSWEVQVVSVLVGLAVGMALVPWWRRAVTARTSRAAQLGALAALLGAVVMWSPAGWVLERGAASALSWRQLVPMLSLYQRQDLSSVFLVLQKAGLGAALGACLVARKRMGAPRPGVRAAVMYATLLELGQVVVPGRYPDMTDILITSSAACLVAIMVERADRGARGPQPGAEMALNG